MASAIGNKAQNLNQLISGSFRVPDFIVLPADSAIEQVIQAVKDRFSKEPHLAVRSSSSVEDSEHSSFAGAFHSAVCVDIEALPLAWRLVAQSMPSSTPNSIIIQQMIFGDFSGVTFADHAQNRVMVNALPGLCKAVVEGYDSDYFEFENGNLIDSILVNNRKGMFFENGAVNLKSNGSSMNATQLELVEKSGIEVSRFFSAPQDIEWTIVDNDIYILQARPITRNPWLKSRTQFFDSANVGESYGGLVLPLTVTFARKLYETVYLDLMRHSGVEEKVLNTHRDVFANLVDTAFGRMYYRMENWYSFLALLPGYERNKRNLENMLMLNIREKEAYEHIRPSARVKIIYFPLVIYKLFLFSRKMRDLDREVRALLSEASNWPIQLLSEKEIQLKIDFLFNGILSKWYLTVENDTAMMTLFALISKGKSKLELLDFLDFHSVSTDQVAALEAIAKAVCAHDELFQSLKQEDEVVFKQQLSKYPELENQYQDYLSRFGSRFANELKLETPDISESFAEFARLLILYAETTKSTEKSKVKSNIPFLARKFRRFAERREVFRLHRAMMFALIRKLVLRKAEIWRQKGFIESREDLFLLDWEHIQGEFNKDFKSLIIQRKLQYKHYQSIEAPAFFKVENGRWPKPQRFDKAMDTGEGMAASAGIASGRALVLTNFEIPKEINFEILVCERTDPGWTALMALSKGIVVEHGGILSHASIVARELGIPAVIGIKGACQIYRTGELLLVDGSAGIVTKLEPDAIQ